MFTIDFETEPIVGNPSVCPPKPVGVAIKYKNEIARYLAWGHTEENNCTHSEAKAELADVWHNKLLFHNSKFDIAVAQAYFGLPFPPNYEDTLFLLFLSDPYSTNLGLKHNADALLSMAPEEQNELNAWILRNTACKTEKHTGEYICQAPGGLVGKYAIGDVDRTKKLYDLLYPKIVELGMEEAYYRETDLMPITLISEKKGVRVDRHRLEEDIEIYEKAIVECEDRLRSILCNSNVDFNKKDQLANALEDVGMVRPEDWLKTPKGRRSVSKESLEHGLKNVDPTVLALLNYRGSVSSALSTFARPWFELSYANGRIHTQWNQVRHHETGNSRGARTGRLSASKPSLMNVTNLIKGDQIEGLPLPPLMRRYLLPEKGHKWLKRDFNSQEVRMLAYFEDKNLMKAYIEDPFLDPHEMARQMIAKFTGVEYSRDDVKVTAFGIIYGMGVRVLSERLGKSLEEASKVKQAYLKLFPGVKALQQLTSKLGDQGEPITTWGGRVYYKEPSREINGRTINFNYKLLNYLIQGSSADQTKQCLIDWWEAKADSNIFLATVHDEINISAPIDTWQSDMKVLKECMNQDYKEGLCSHKNYFDVPMRSKGSVGVNWYDLEDLDNET